MRSWLSIQPVEQISGKEDSKGTQSGKYDHKRKADLTEQLKWLAAIVPHCHMEPFIDDDSGDEFHTGHKDDTS